MPERKVSKKTRPDCGLIATLLSLEGYYGVAIINSTLPLTAWFGTGAFAVLQHNNCTRPFLSPRMRCCPGTFFTLLMISVTGK